MKRERRSDAAWAELLDAKGIDLAAARLPITLTMRELEALGQREPRLMLSMDTRSKWPAPLRNHGVFPLSTSTKELVLLKGDGWFDLPRIPGKRRIYEARLPFALASSMIGKGENTHIMRLETSGFLRDFLGADQIVPVSSGKRMTPSFTVLVHGTRVDVGGAQYEMDAQYESAEDIVPVEMKPSHYESCSIRQVYFPYRSLGITTNWSKPVRPLYITHSQEKDDYVIRELGFRSRDVWESIYETRAEAVQIKVVAPKRLVLDLTSREIADERIPQADSVARIAEFPLIVARGMTRSSVVAEYFDFDKRQSSYYRDAVQSLGFVEFDGRDYRLTTDGRRYVELEPQGRADYLSRRMSRLPVFRAVLLALEESGGQGIAVKSIPDIILQYASDRKQKCNATTARRRASTLRAYLDYVGSRTGALARIGDRYYLRKNIPNLDAFQ